MLVTNGGEIAGQLGAFVRIEPGGGLVEAEQHRLRAHGASDFEAALRAIGQFACRIVGARGETGLVEPVARPLDRGVFRAHVAAEADRAEHGESGGEHQRIVLGDQQILQHGHALKQADVLERAHHPRLCAYQIVRHALEQKQSAAGRARALRVPRSVKARQVSSHTPGSPNCSAMRPSVGL